MLPEPGMKIPAVTIRTKSEEGIEELETAAYFAGRKIVLFAVPGAFTPTCSAKHLPDYLENLDQLAAAGFDAVACLSINDAHVMKAWSDMNGATGKIDMLADMRAEFFRARWALPPILGMFWQSEPSDALWLLKMAQSHMYLLKSQAFLVGQAPGMSCQLSARF